MSLTKQRSIDNLKDKIEEAFPFDEPREGQFELIEYIVNKFNEGKRFVVVEAPTGSGKSVVGATVAKLMGNAYYLTATKILQDQLSSDFGTEGKHSIDMKDLKGRNSYECTYFREKADKMLELKIINNQIANKWKTEYFDCADGHCKRKGEGRYDECDCPYFNALDAAMGSTVCSMNYYSFLYQVHFTNERFSPRDVLILDEGHNAEEVLLDFVTLTFKEADFPQTHFPVMDSPAEYAEWMEEAKLATRIQSIIVEATKEEDVKKVDQYKNILSRLEQFMAQMGDPSNHDKWVVQENVIDSQRILQFKPIMVNNYAHDLLFSMGKYVLIMSATILDANVLSRSLGIDREQMAAKRIKSNFPIENRPIYFLPMVKVTGGKRRMDQWGPKLVETVDKIVSTHDSWKGIIHTHNTYIADLIYDTCCESTRYRLTYQRYYNDKKDLLEDHANKKNSVIIAPGMHEGIDLRHDLSRFQILCKVPFANFYENIQLKARMDLDNKYYDWLTALKLVQSVGRSVRSKDDWAKTYIIDSTFSWWYKNVESILPAWFTEAVEFK